MKRIKIKEEDSFGIYELSGELPETIKWLEELKNQGWETIDIESDYEGEPWIVVSCYREETDEEFEKRKKKLQTNKKLKKKLKTAQEKEQEEKELALYQKLKQKYEIV